MNKFLLITVFTILYTSAFAANTAQFVDANGNDVSGKTVEAFVSTEENPLTQELTYVAYSNLSFKNTENEDAFVKITSNISELSNGTHQICFGSCIYHDKVGEYSQGANAVPVAANSAMPLAAEWIPADGATSGQCVVEYKAAFFSETPPFSYEYLADGPSVKVIYKFDGSGGINNLHADRKVVAESYYDLLGCQIENPNSGIYIKRMIYNDGSVKAVKVHVK